MVLEQVKGAFRLANDGERIQLKHAQIRRAMKSRDLFRDIFVLAVRLLGLVFLYFGLSAVPPILDFGAIETAEKGDIINVILPMVFNLAVAWWLLGGGLLIRRAYPEASRIFPHSHAPGEGSAPATKPAQSQETTDMDAAVDAADKKLAPLVGKPKNDRAG
jgi:hypothetical protein